MFASSKIAAVVNGAVNYIEEVFSTYLYTGNSTTGGTQTITNSIDLSTKGGMVWIKGRSAASSNILTDTTRGAGTTASNNQALSSNLTTAEDLAASYDFLSAFNTDGFTVKQGGTTAATRGTNYNAVTYASWTFRNQPKFFDIQTWTGSGSNRTISHSLGSVPACIIVKRTDTTGDWQVYHRSLANTEYLVLNTTAAKATGATRWNSTTPTSTVFSLGTDATVNASGGTYVAYIFAHDAGGFGLTGTDNVISCGSFTTDGSGNASISLGYEPQWVLAKMTNTADFWYLMDNMRGMPVGSATAAGLYPNSSGVENQNLQITLTPTGFNCDADFQASTGAQTWIYIAIRRGPMKVPTDATKVFGLSARTGTGANATVTGGQTDDAVLVKNRGSAVASLISSRLTGTGYLVTSSSTVEVAAGTTILQANPWDVMDGVKVGTTDTITNASANTYINYLFKRAPSFFDEVCYSGTGSDGQVISHNLGVAPELAICMSRNVDGGFKQDYNYVYCSSLGIATTLGLNSSTYKDTGGGLFTVTPTSTSLTLRSVNNDGLSTNYSNSTYLMYLFATCAGVSKVGSYTGTATTLQIDCGFTGGARFVLIKRTDSSGAWYVWDTARGIVAGNDPYLLLNSTAAEVTNTDYIDTYSAGFELSSTAPTALNASGGTYIFLAIA
jgi:hypothetical protein